MSECYIKNYTFKIGPCSSRFTHITLDRMIDFLKDALKLVPQRGDWSEWLSQLTKEQNKRKNYKPILETYANFRKSYLSVANEIDFPPHRSFLGVPELAFPLFAEIADLWNRNSTYTSKYGRVTVYPVPRNRQISDSVLNFTELWFNPRKDNIMTCGGLIPYSEENRFYFEFNEDFNLHLKINLDDANLAKTIQRFIHNQASLFSIKGVKGSPVEYFQEVYVFCEWDVDLLGNLSSLNVALDNTFRVIDTTVNCLR